MKVRPALDPTHLDNFQNYVGFATNVLKLNVNAIFKLKEKHTKPKIKMFFNALYLEKEASGISTFALRIAPTTSAFNIFRFCPVYKLHKAHLNHL